MRENVMRVKKVVFRVAGMVMVMSLFAGCGKSGSGTETDSSVVSKETANVSTDAKNEDITSDVSSWHICGLYCSLSGNSQ